MNSSAKSRLRALVRRAVSVLPLAPPGSSTLSSSEHVAIDNGEISSGELDVVQWNHSVVQLLQSTSSLGGLHPSQWGGLKVRCLQHLKVMTPQTALVCLQTFAHHRACGKTEAMRLQESIATGYDGQSLTIVNQTRVLLTLCTLRVGLSPVLQPHVQSTIDKVIQACPSPLVPRLVYAVYTLLRENAGADTLSGILARASDVSTLRDFTASDRIYLLWATDLVLSASRHTRPRHTQAFRTLVEQSLGLLAQPSLHVQPSHVKQMLSPEPLSVDVLLGKTKPSWQLQPKDVVLLLHTVCRLVGATTGGTGAVGSQYYERRLRTPNSNGESLVDDTLLSFGEPESQPVAHLKGHLNALCHRLTVSLLCCEFVGLPTACHTLEVLARCGAVYWSTEAQIVMHLLIRYVLFQYRDAVYFEQGTLSRAIEEDELGEMSGLVVLRDVPQLSAEEHARLVQLRLTTSVATLEAMKLRLRRNVTVDQLTVLLAVLCATDDIFGRSRAAPSATPLANQSGNDHMTFASYYKAMIAVKMQRSLQIAAPSELPRLIAAACRCGGLTAVSVNMCVQRLALDPDRVAGPAVRNSCQLLHQYSKKHSVELWSTSEPPAGIVAPLALVGTAEDVETSALLTEICDASAKPERHHELEQLWLAVYRRRGPDAPRPSDVRTALRKMAKHHLRHFSQRSSLQATAPRMIQRACHEAPLPDMLDTLIAAHLVGVSSKSITPLAERVVELLRAAATSQYTFSFVAKWLQVCSLLGSVALWRATPFHVKEVLEVGLANNVSTTGALSCLASLFTLGDDSPKLIVAALELLRQSPDDERLAVAPLIASTVLLSWRASRSASRNLCALSANVLYMALQQIKTAKEAEKNGRTLWLVSAAATVVMDEGCEDGESSKEINLLIKNEIARCTRLLCGADDEARTTFSLTKAISLVSEHPGASDPSLRHLVHPCAMCGIVAQVLQSQGQDDGTKLFGAQLWRQCVKFMEKLATTFSAALNGTAVASAVAGPAGLNSPLTSLTPSTAEDHAYEGLVLMSLIASMVRCGASSQSLDLLAQKWMRRSPHSVDLVGVGMIAEGLVATGKRRPALAEFVTYCVEECSGDGAVDLACIPAHLLASIVLMTQRDGDRVSITLARADVVKAVVWSALEQRLPRLHPKTILQLLPHCAPFALEALCDVVAACVAPVVEPDELLQAFGTLQALGATSKDLTKLELAATKRAENLLERASSA